MAESERRNAPWRKSQRLPLRLWNPLGQVSAWNFVSLFPDRFQRVRLTSNGQGSEEASKSTYKRLKFVLNEAGFSAL
jgi:hypothetical protein